MSCTRLQAIITRESRAFVADHVAFATVLLMLGSIITALAR